jgi:hypothetical protein
MSVTRVDTDPEALTMTVTATFDAPVDQVSGRSGPIHASSRAGGVLRRIRQPSSSTTSCRAEGLPTS